MSAPGTSVPFYDVNASQADAAADVEAAVARVLRSGWYVLGPECEAFEAEFARACGVRHCVGVGQGLDALRLSLTALGIGPGDEVIVPAMTFVATWLAVSQAGALPVPCDVDPSTGLIDADAVAAAVTPATAAVMPVHLYGQPADMTALRAVTDRHGLALVEDAAQAHLASIGPTRCGAFGAAAGFSFYPGKNLGALGDAGAVTTDDDALAASLRKLRNYGSAERYRHDTVGMNSRLDEVQAAVLRAKLPHLERWTARRAALAARYTAGLADAVEPLQVIAGRRHAWHLYVVRVGDPDGLARELAAGGVGTLRHYPVPPHRSGAYAATHGHLRFPGADALASSCLSLPFGPAVDAATADRVVGAVRAARHASPMGASAR